MFEQLEEPKKASQVSRAMTFGIAAAYLVGAFGGPFLFFFLEERPFGIQIATAVTYTYFAFWFVFFPTRGMLEKYSLRDERIQRKIPLLLAIHCAFLISLLLAQIEWLGMKPYLSSYWFTEHGKKGDTLYELVMIGTPVLVFFAQVLTSRGILSRRLAKNRDVAA